MFEPFYEGDFEEETTEAQGTPWRRFLDRLRPRREVSSGIEGHHHHSLRELAANPIQRHPRLFAAGVGVYLAVISGLMMINGDSIEPEELALALLLAAIVLGAGKRFLRDWTPFLVLILAYEAMRGVVGAARVHPHDVTWMEQAVWAGTLPTVTLQRMFYRPDAVGLQDQLATAVYFAHFLLPIAFGFVLWLRSSQAYFQFTFSLLLLCFLAFITYLLWPSAPPWYAHADIVHRVMTEAMAKGGLARAASPLYSHFDPNQFAAFPSLHAGFPTLVAIHAWRRSRAWGITFGVWTLVVWLAVVYLGEHYSVDALAGLVYAVFATMIVDRFAGISATRHAEMARPGPAPGPLGAGVTLASRVSPTRFFTGS